MRHARQDFANKKYAPQEEDFFSANPLGPGLSGKRIVQKFATQNAYRYFYARYYSQKKEIKVRRIKPGKQLDAAGSEWEKLTWKYMTGLEGEANERKISSYEKIIRAYFI